jgi:hypothetical protein
LPKFIFSLKFVICDFKKLWTPFSSRDSYANIGEEFSLRSEIKLKTKRDENEN